MIFVGGGAYDATPEIRELSAMLQAPVVSYQNGRGIVDERTPYALNHPAGSEYWGDCDAALAIGCRMQVERSFWGLDDSVKVIHVDRSEEHTSELQSLMRISYAVFCLKTKKQI